MKATFIGLVLLAVLGIAIFRFLPSATQTISEATNCDVDESCPIRLIKINEHNISLVDSQRLETVIGALPEFSTTQERVIKFTPRTLSKSAEFTNDCACRYHDRFCKKVYDDISDFALEQIAHDYSEKVDSCTSERLREWREEQAMTKVSAGSQKESEDAETPSPTGLAYSGYAGNCEAPPCVIIFPDRIDIFFACDRYKELEVFIDDANNPKSTPIKRVFQRSKYKESFTINRLNQGALSSMKNLVVTVEGNPIDRSKRKRDHLMKISETEPQLVGR